MKRIEGSNGQMVSYNEEEICDEEGDTITRAFNKSLRK
jgi:hypothetical protein